MARKSRENPAVREFILRNVGEHPASIVSLAMDNFSYSRPAILRYVQKLEGEGLLTFTGNTYARRYQLKALIKETFTLKVDHLWSEDMVWRERIAPLMKGIRQNVIDICQYGFTEMLNNVLDHATSPEAIIGYYQDFAHVGMTVADRGIGIFKKIQQDFKLEDPRTALLELSKGRLTSDKKNHTGWGIYFTSRAFDRFRLRSGNLYYSREKRDGDDWLIEVNDRSATFEGTIVRMLIRADADWTMKEVFEKFQGDDMRFRKTHVPVKLAQYPGEQLVSRSQAKRLLTRFDNFSEVFLDFRDVQEIRQPFADEIFRVFHNAHPEIEIRIANANKDIRKMIEFVTGENTSKSA